MSLALCAVSAAGQVAEGDRLFAMRAEGHKGAVARPERVDGAIAAYQRGIASSPEDLEPRVRLLAALRFKGAYVATSREEKRRIFDQGRQVSEKAFALLDRKLAGLNIASSAKAPVSALATAARTIPHAGELFYWDAVHWGEWALVYGKMAAAREGAADRIRRNATIAHLSDPKIESGGGARVLGRLHNQTPRIPFVTGWASDREAVKFLRESVALGPGVKITKVFLAEALVAADSKSRPEAFALLDEVVRTPNGTTHLVENLAAQQDAAVLLKQWGR